MTILLVIYLVKMHVTFQKNYDYLKYNENVEQKENHRARTEDTRNFVKKEN